MFLVYITLCCTHANGAAKTASNQKLKQTGVQYSPRDKKKKIINTSAFYSVQCNIHQRMDQRKTRRKKQFFKLDDAKSYASLADSIPRISLFLPLPSSLLSSVISVTLLSEPITALILLPQRIPVTLLYKQLPGTGLMYSFRIVLQT